MGHIAILQTATRRRRIQYRRRRYARQRNSHHAHHRWGRPRHDGLFQEAVRGRCDSRWNCLSGRAGREGADRTIMTGEHTRAQLDQALETISRIGKRMSLLG